MELLPPMTGFYMAIENDIRIGTTHIRLYMALLQQWNWNGGLNLVIIARAEIMRAAKIYARYTFNKSINILHEFSYIDYKPSTNPFNNSTVYLKEL